MRLPQQLLGGYLVSRFVNRRRRQGYGGRRAMYPGRRQQRRGGVQVTGCCLPIPCGVVVGLGAIGTTVAVRDRA